SRTRSAVGRVRPPFGATRRRPPSSPAITRMRPPAGCRSGLEEAREVGEALAHRPPQERVLRPLEARVVAQRPPRDLACLGQLAAVAGEARVAGVRGPGLPNPPDAAPAPGLEVQLGHAGSAPRLDARLHE